jgi:hypothetical protein
MKKVSSLFLISMFMVMTLCSQASAYFDVDHLIQVVYNAGTIERATDLGVIGGSIALDYHGAAQTLAAAGTIDPSAFGVENGWADLSVAYFAWNDTDPNRIGYFATTVNTDQGANKTPFTNFRTSAARVKDTYSALGGPTVNSSASADNGYNMKMNQGGSVPGAYGAFNKSPETGEASLADLLTIGYVDMYLYKYTVGTVVSLVSGPDATTDYIAIIRLFADGSTKLMDSNPAAVPIPASFLLFGSGILGMFGLKRKNA